MSVLWPISSVLNTVTQLWYVDAHGRNQRGRGAWHPPWLPYILDG